ncbi:hypothetical protein FQV27_04645 [Paracoccus aurantiacus]|uniref:Protein ImuA n=1 Tax=Paracoccus aurantiacus TaxID=2599412 RepID=A0A5C6S9I8_9RHOB|nr:hypothetical protein [Paracoccus aurantiacus]TXB71141.1 hypothetical protein FQV27_04645 [Paracoccus aurantiacus]
MTTTIPDMFRLRPGRTHEACGPAAASFAAIAAAGVTGNFLWVRERWVTGRLNPLGLHRFLDPARLLLAEVADQTEALAVAEEALRDGALRLIVTELSQPLSLTQGRRLQLAAQAGSSIGLGLIPEGLGSNATETRWLCSPVFDPAEKADSTLQEWKLIKNKSGTLGHWHVRWDAKAHRLDVVSPVGERPGPTASAG